MFLEKRLNVFPKRSICIQEKVGMFLGKGAYLTKGKRMEEDPLALRKGISRSTGTRYVISALSFVERGFCKLFGV